MTAGPSAEAVLIRILPALPTAWLKGRISNLCCRGGITLSVKWDQDGGHVAVEFLSQTTQTVDIVWPGGDAPQAYELRAGEAVTVHCDSLFGAGK